MMSSPPPVVIRRLALYNFKCYPSLSMDFEAPVVCLLGNNGAGKTNLLDALHYLGFSRSYFNTVDSQNIRSGEDQGSISGEFERHGQPEHIVCAIRKGQRKVLKRNHKEYDKLADHIGLLPAVMITPYDTELVLEGSEVRRRFIDATISQVSRPYLQHLVRYNHALQQRNNLLKQCGRQGQLPAELLEPWDYQLTEHGEAIHRYRTEFLAAFAPVFTATYQRVSGGKEAPSIVYQSDLDDASFSSLLSENRERDRVLERTSRGIHRDELEFELDGLSLKRFASQGQQKSFLIALKLAQYRYLRDGLDLLPLLLLDDLFDKLDETRVGNLLREVCAEGHGQVFITDTHLGRIPALLEKLGVRFEAWEVESAAVRRIS